MSLEVKEFKAKQEKKIEDDKKKAEKKAAGETVSLHTRAQIQIAGLPFRGLCRTCFWHCPAKGSRPSFCYYYIPDLRVLI